MVTKDPQLSKVERRDAARAQALKMQQEQLRREKRTRAVIMGSLIAGVLVVAGVVYMILSNAPEDLQGIKEIPESVEAPAVADEAGGISFGNSGEAGSTSGDDAVTVDVYLDYLCPNCAQFEAANGPDLDELRSNGEITLVVHPVSILDSVSEGYSTRAAQAFAYVAENSPEHALDFSAALFTMQPAEGTSGLSDDQLEELAVETGVPADVAAGIAEQQYAQFVAALTQVAYGDPSVLNAEGGFGTPTVVINGERFNGNWMEPGALTGAIAEAKPAAPVAP